MEVYYRPTEIAAGESWRMSYELTPITGAGGVVHASDEIALSLEPPALRAETDYAVMLHALGAEAARQIVMRGTLANSDVEAFEDTFEATALAPARVEL